MALDTTAPLKRIVGIPAGVPVTLRELNALGISSQLAHWYTKNGWLERLGRGVFVRDARRLDLPASLAILERYRPDVHVGGRTALDWTGVRHFARKKSPIFLYGSDSLAIPAWLRTRFEVIYRRKRLFREKPRRMLAVSRLPDVAHSPLVSEPERAVLELLSEVPNRQSVEEAKLLLEGLLTLRPKLLQSLLNSCTSVKTVRLFVNWSKELKLPHVTQLDTRKLARGSSSRYVYKLGDTTLVLKP